MIGGMHKEYEKEVLRTYVSLFSVLLPMFTSERGLRVCFSSGEIGGFFARLRVDR